MRFLLYNIRYATGMGVRFHTPLPYAGFLKRSRTNLAAIIAFIKSMAPDVVGLVEVDGGSYRADGLDQAEVIAEELGHLRIIETKYHAGSLARRLPILSRQCNAVITGMKIKSHLFHYFEHGMKRLVIEVELEEVTIFLVHLALAFRHRQYQLEQLHRLVSRVEKPVIVAGDFNVFWGERELRLFLAATGLRSANNAGEPSHPSSAPSRQLDFILHGPDLRVENFYIPQVRFSDHVPLVCDFSFT